MKMRGIRIILLKSELWRDLGVKQNTADRHYQGATFFTNNILCYQNEPINFIVLLLYSMSDASQCTDFFGVKRDLRDLLAASFLFLLRRNGSQSFKCFGIPTDFDQAQRSTG